MKDTSYDQSPWNRRTSNKEMMYKAWRVHDQQRDINSWDQVKLSRSRSLLDVQGRAPIKTKVTNPDRFNGSERANSLNRGLTKATRVKQMEGPHFQITVDQPIRHVTPSCNVSFPLWANPAPSIYGNQRRASDGLLSSTLPISRKATVFSTLTEEFGAIESPSSLSAANNYNSGVSSVNCRRFSDGCFRSAPAYKEYKKISAQVLPQPRLSVKEEAVTSGSDQAAGESDKDLKDFENADCVRNEEEDRWKELVAKAQGFKSTKANAASKQKGVQLEDVKGDISHSSEMEEVCSDVSSEASFSSSSSYHSSSEGDSNVYSALMVNKPISGELANYKAEGHTRVTSNSARAVRRSSVQPLIDSNSRESHPRRYSLATVSPARSFDPRETAKLSGYSTQSALEQARQLLGKLQSEGKNKNKKDRLEELSRALKWILEELNRIETPDRELVSLFISLRAKIVNLKADLKAEEFDATSVDPTEEIDSAPTMQKLMTEDSMSKARARRFSWC